MSSPTRYTDLLSISHYLNDMKEYKKSLSENHRNNSILKKMGISILSICLLFAFALIGFLPFLYYVFSSFFTFQLDYAIFNNDIREAKKQLKYTYVARGLIFLVAALAYGGHTIYDRFYRTPDEEHLQTSYSIHIIEYIAIVIVIIYSVCMLYFGLY